MGWLDPSKENSVVGRDATMAEKGMAYSVAIDDGGHTSRPPRCHTFATNVNESLAIWLRERGLRW